MKILELLTPRKITGNLGERLAIKFLKKSGYKIKAKNYVAGDIEIDIIAEDRTTVAFIEVKTRTVGHESPREPRPASAVTQEKQRKIISASRHYTSRNNLAKRIRMDVIEVYLNDDKTKNKIIHIENAFNLNTAYERKANTK